jgi:shikimate dehydrogenase
VVTRKAGVIGWPVKHSLSPLIHKTWGEREGRTIGYDAIPVEATDDAFRAAIERLSADGYKGVNVTLPHKERALKIADEASGEARAAGAANMLTFGKRRILADNSDIAGFAAAIDETGRKPTNAVILGAGGAARGVAVAVKRKLGAARITILNRTRARGDDVARLVDARTLDWSDRNAALAGADLLVNTTSLGMTGEGPLDIDLAALAATAIVAEIVYSPLETPLLRAARAKGCVTVDGLSMLMHQAAFGYRAWLGSTAVVDQDLRARLVAALEARGAA